VRGGGWRGVLMSAVWLACPLMAFGHVVTEEQAAVKIRILPDEKQPLVPGVLASMLQVAIRNATADRDKNRSPSAIVLRGVWWDYPPDDWRWRAPTQGTMTERPDGTIAHNTAAQGMTHLAVERGLLFPGEERLVTVPLTPQHWSRQALVITYSVVPEEPDGGYDQTIWLAEWISPKSPGKIEVTYYPATVERIHERRNHNAVNGFAILRATKQPEAPDLMTELVSLTRELPLMTTTSATAGLTMVDAAKRAGVDLLNESYLGFYREPLKAWFFVRDDGRAVALRQVVDPRAMIDPAAETGYTWRLEELPRMAADVLDELCLVEGVGTIMVLPEAMRQQFPLATSPETRTSALAPEEVWQVFEMAHAQGLSLRRVVTQPGDYPVVAVGVEQTE